MEIPILKIGDELIFNIFKVSLLIPSIFVKKIHGNEWCDDNLIKMGVIVDTKIYFEKSDSHWGFIFCIFGFGFCLNRQWGY